MPRGNVITIVISQSPKGIIEYNGQSTIGPVGNNHNIEKCNHVRPIIYENHFSRIITPFNCSKIQT